MWVEILRNYAMRQGRTCGNNIRLEENTIIGKGERLTSKVKVNIDKVRVYHPRQSDTISFDSHDETLYEGQRSSNGSSRSHPGKSKRSRKTSSEESKGRKSNKRIAGLAVSRLKRKVKSNGSVERTDKKRSKICRKRSLQGSEHGDQKRPTSVPPQRIKRTVPSSITSRNYKYRRPNNPSQGQQSIAGPSDQLDTKQCKLPTEERRQGARVQYDRAQETRTTPSRGNSAAERRPVRSRQATAVRPCPYYLRIRLKKPEGIPEEQRSTGIDSLPQNLRRRSLSMEALDGDPVDRSEERTKKKIRLYRFFFFPFEQVVGRIIAMKQVTGGCLKFKKPSRSGHYNECVFLEEKNKLLS
ncbi:uncharacterized protein TNCV_1356111 [Trichonephila clavipes]|uniref:Uncharacterized protein n=1 Tax=Trichonephila clavipes TaxID=2585209 RepID=A0A8X6VHP5_TRICX|nr:uncharacterized protein TNCV_1356111 [Trichonephila clavipes]